MFNFEFYNPTHIVFGKNSIEKIDSLIPLDAKVLIIYGKSSIKKNGTLDEVKSSLGKRVFAEFSGVEPNPTYETLMKAVLKIRDEKYDFLLAVGGGSVIDGVKFIAAAVNYKDEPWNILLDSGTSVKSAIPFGTVLTLPATGSEMNNGAVISNIKEKRKLAFFSKYTFPLFSVLDPIKTYTLDDRQIANGIVDTFIHICEQYITYPANGAVQDGFSEALLRSLIKISPKLMQEEPEYDSRANFMWIATLALNGLIGAGVPQDWATHMISHEITALYGIDHARALALVFTSLLKECKQDKKEKLLQYARNVWCVNDLDDDLAIDLAIIKTSDFFEKLGIPTNLSSYGLKENDVKNIINNLSLQKFDGLGEKNSITLKRIETILNNGL